MTGATACRSMGKEGNGATPGTASGPVATNLTKSSSTAKAVYFITNIRNNSIVALKVAANGTLSDGSITTTGGLGMSGVDSTGNPAAPDSLFSQGAIKISGNQ
ncbi:hypothetical protein EG329_008885 [Mollisiaceae sp. DMI_Dod_QoI]|nr:hypothetical protein EG329_008885 [Helotiales sp. DMI_Dod_QoI]